MARQSRWLTLLAVCLLLSGSLAAAAELEGFDEVEDEPPAVQDPVKAVRWPGTSQAPPLALPQGIHAHCAQRHSSRSVVT